MQFFLQTHERNNLKKTDANSSGGWGDLRLTFSQRLFDLSHSLLIGWQPTGFPSFNAAPNVYQVDVGLEKLRAEFVEASADEIETVFKHFNVGSGVVGGGVHDVVDVA